MYKDVNCPYCNHYQNINHDDGYGYSESETHQQHCKKCGKEFDFTTSIIFHYEVYKKEGVNNE